MPLTHRTLLQQHRCAPRPGAGLLADDVSLPPRRQRVHRGRPRRVCDRQRGVRVGPGGAARRWARPHARGARLCGRRRRRLLRRRIRVADSACSGFERDTARAVALLEATCAGGHSNACFQLGWNYEFGCTVARDHARAAVFYHQACEDAVTGDDMGMMACHFLGSAYSEGRGVAMDPIRAAQLYDRACRNGNGSGMQQPWPAVSGRTHRRGQGSSSCGAALRPRLPAR